VSTTTEEQEPDKFAEYYREASLSQGAMARFLSIKQVVDGVLHDSGRQNTPLDVADIGCGAGTQCALWARDGHRVRGIDINSTLVDIARQRATELDLPIEYYKGSADALPWKDQSMDVCLVPELLEHVPNWRKCLDEFARILRPAGVIYLSTNNVLCPVQQEFDLPLYSWYPGFMKRRYERLAVTSRPELVNHAEFPAVHWFSYYRLRKAFSKRQFDVYDRFDAVRLEDKGRLARLAIGLIKTFPPLRFFGHVVTPYSAVVALKRSG
jgi:2-polyprenyl-6-hydroxyphenyl methylase/3-demethylubiquinone-9 3-methyltransferase